MRYRHDGFQQAARISAAIALLAAVVLLALAETASADSGKAEAAGLQSRAQIQAFQRAHGLKPDGVVGPDTRFALQTVPRAHARLAAAAGGGASSPAAIASPPSGRHGHVEYLVMFLAGLAILAGLAVWKLGEPALYRVRMLRDSLRRAPGSATPGVRWVSDEMFAEGRAPRAGIGSFRGTVAAITELRGERCFLVRDPTKPRGVWVFESEIRDLVEV
jgi:peptidoglycan hydrolase-like protein with peptidoglycan-binding domain